MNIDYNILQKCPLFNGIQNDDFEDMLHCLMAKEYVFKKGETILDEGSPAKYIGIVISGKAQIERVDYYGNRTILTNIEPSQIFGESFACSDIETMPVGVIATKDTVVMIIDASRIMQSNGNSCTFHNKLIFNLLNITTSKNLIFHQKIEITSKRTTREKLMTYLLIQAKNNNSNSFTIPYNRQELADYLGVERSGLSVVISELKKQNILKCKNNMFTITDKSK